MKKMRAVLIGICLAGVVLQCGANSGADAPQDFIAAVRRQQENKFGENDIKSFVHHVFALYDKHVEVSRFLPLLVDKGLEMRFPETTLRSHQDFKRWYAGIGKNIRSNTHQVERITVTFVGNGKYKVDLIVLWQAITKEDRFVYFRAHQVWTLDDGKESNWPRILAYIVEEEPGPAEAPK